MNNSGKTSFMHTIGEEIHVRFGIPANRMFYEAVGADPSKYYTGPTMNEAALSQILYCGYCNHCAVEDKQPVYGIGFFLQYVEEAFVDDEIGKELARVVNCWQDSKYTAKITEGLKEKIEEVKKKSLIGN